MQFRKDVYIDLDLSSDVYRKCNLNEDEVRYLLNYGYAEEQCRAIDAKRQEPFLIKKKHKESVQHVFVVWLISDFIRDFTSDIEIRDTVGADIIFESPIGEFAVEIETGYTLKHNKKALMRKINKLNERFDNNWCFVVTTKEVRRQYQRLGRTFTRLNFYRLMNELFPLYDPLILPQEALYRPNSINSSARIGSSTSNIK